MRFLIFFIMISCFFRVCASDYTLLDASGGAWDGSGLFRRMLSEKVSLLPEKDSLALEKVSALPDKLEAGQIAVVAGNAEDWKNKGYRCRFIGRAVVVAAAGKDCPLENISIEDLQRIYSGRAASWARFGGRDLPIRRAGYAAETPVGTVFARLVMQQGGKADELDSQIAPGMLAVSSAAGCRALLQAVPGIIVFGSEDLLPLKIAGCKALKINGILPESAAIADGRYPLAVPLNMVAGKDTPEKIVDALADFLQSSMQKKLDPAADSDKK